MGIVVAGEDRGVEPAERTRRRHRDGELGADVSDELCVARTLAGDDDVADREGDPDLRIVRVDGSAGAVIVRSPGPDWLPRWIP